MRVKISYGLDIKDVPEKVRDIIYDSMEDLRLVLDLLERVSNDLGRCEENVGHIFETIDKTRLKLSGIDLSITDAQAIVEGLKNYYEGEKDVPERRPTVDPSGDSNVQTENPGDR